MGEDESVCCMVMGKNNLLTLLFKYLLYSHIIEQKYTTNTTNIVNISEAVFLATILLPPATLSKPSHTWKQ